MAGPGDQIAAGAGGYSYRRTSHVDRERVIDILEAAFVQRRLARDEFDLRVWAAGHDAAGQRLVTRLWNPTGMSSLLVLRGRRRRRGGGRGATRVVAGCGEPAAEHGGEAVGVFDVGQVPAIGNTDNRPWGRLSAGTRWVRARAGITHRQLVAPCSCPCSRSNSGPAPASRYWVSTPSTVIRRS